MKQFLTAGDAAFRELETRATWACVRFRDQEMPFRCDPPRADIGFEIDEVTHAARLLVSKGTRYGGDNQEVSEWLNMGVKEFPTFTALRTWIKGPLAQAFAVQGPQITTASVGDPNPTPNHTLTDMAVVQQGVRKMHRPLYLDEATLLRHLQERILGQDSALQALASVMVRHCARRFPARPAVVFAVGPSGVGKTRTAEVLGSVLNELCPENNGYQFLRLDMTEYQEPHRVSQLIGAPQGYAGHGDGSQLTDALRANPRTIVLFDEIEKAHPAILRVLMNVMDAGRLSTASRAAGSHEIDCRQSMFVFTSNLDAKDILDELEVRRAFGNSSVEDEVCRRRLHASGIAPEIVGRIGRFAVYRPLTPNTRAEIVTLAISEVAKEYGIQVAYIEPNIIIELMDKVQSKSFGVRPERFLIDEALGSAFAQAAAGGLVCPIRICGEHPYRCETHDTHPSETTSSNQPSSEMRSPKPEQGDPACPAR